MPTLTAFSDNAFQTNAFQVEADVEGSVRILPMFGVLRLSMGSVCIVPIEGMVRL